MKATQLRNRRRHLARQVLKRIPHAARLSATRLLRTATMVLALWGITGLTLPPQTQAQALFKHVMLKGFGALDQSQPALADIDGDFDAFVGASYAAVFYKNYSVEDGNANTIPCFVNLTGAANPVDGLLPGRNINPAFADIDNDGDIDAFVGDVNDTIRFFENLDPSSAPLILADGFEGSSGKSTRLDLEDWQ